MTTTNKRVKNTTATDGVWLGQDIPPGEYYDLQAENLAPWADDPSVIASLLSGDLVANNTIQDITDPQAGLNFILGARRIGFSLNTSPNGVLITATVNSTISEYLWIQSRGFNYINGVIVYQATVPSNQSLQLRLQDVTNGVTLGTQTVNASGIYFFSFSNPTTDAGLELQARKTSTLALNPTVRAAALEWDLI